MSFEYMIAGKTHSEILAMTNQQRYLWYKTILSGEKEKAMQLVEIIRRAKIGVSKTGEICLEETKVRMSVAKIGENHPMYGKTQTKESNAKRCISMMKRWKDPEYRGAHKEAMNQPDVKIKMSMAAKLRVGENNPFFGSIHTEKTKARQSEVKMGEKHPMYGKLRPHHSERMKGENNPNHIDGRSFLPYCHLFNDEKKEEIRNCWGRVCVLTDLMRSILGSDSGLDDFEGHEIFNGRRYSVHHIRGDKMAGCDGTELALIPLQGKFNTMKFDGLRLEDHPFYITLFLLKDIERKHREETLRECIRHKEG